MYPPSLPAEFNSTADISRASVFVVMQTIQPTPGTKKVRRDSLGGKREDGNRRSSAPSPWARNRRSPVRLLGAFSAVGAGPRNSSPSAIREGRSDPVVSSQNLQDPDRGKCKVRTRTRPAGAGWPGARARQRDGPPGSQRPSFSATWGTALVSCGPASGSCRWARTDSSSAAWRSADTPRVLA